ncbi:ash family protein [Salmonella enterica]|uniref:ash family protein n=1 Tax=Salmonella enterica TaxID=28901 RepID=UPI003D322EA7
MCFIVLPERSKSFFIFSCCIGSYHWCSVSLDGNYHQAINQLKTAKPRSAGTLARLLTSHVKETNAMATPQCNQTRPKFQYRFMALDRADRQAKPCPYTGQGGSYQPLNIFLQNFAICHLPLHATACYRNSAPYKTGVGIGTPISKKATPDAASVFFVVCHTSHSMAWCATLPQRIQHLLSVIRVYHATHNSAMCGYSAELDPSTDTLNSTPRRQRMVTLAGQPQGWPVSFLPGSSNPVNVTAPIEIGTSGGDSLTSKKEAA